MLTCWWQYIVNKYEDGLFCTQFDSFSYNIHKLSNGQVRRDKIPVIASVR